MPTLIVVSPPPDGFTYWFESGAYVLEDGALVLLETPGTSAPSLALTGQSATLTSGRAITVGSASLTLTPVAVSLAVPANPPLTIGSASLTLTGQSVGLRAGRKISAVPALMRLDTTDVQLYGPDAPLSSFDLQDLRWYRLRRAGERVFSYGRPR